MQIRIKDRLKHPRIVVEENGEVFLEVNSKDEHNHKLHKKILSANKEWISEQVKIKDKNRPHPTDKTYEFINGMAIYILGKPYKLKLIKGEKTRIEGKTLIVGKSNVKVEIKHFFIQSYTDFILSRVEHFRIQLGVKAPSIRFKNYPKKLGENVDGKVFLNWKIIMLEPSLIDYIVLHELSHLKEMNHGKKFWELIKKIMPDYKNRENQVRLQLSLMWNF